MRYLIFLVILAATSAWAETVPDRKGAVLGDRAALENDPRWIYNDYQRGFALAKETGKPLLVVIRCVPCLACAGIDAQVLQEKALVPLLDQFVCVRLINANALDLALFQFDYDLSFSTLIFNGDGTIYGRYGSWTHQRNAADKTTAGYKRALEAALAIHRGYPANKAELSGKQGLPLPFKTPLEFPQLANKYSSKLDWDGKVVQSCVHCHQVSDAIRASYRSQKQSIPLRWVYPWPAPETIGLTLAPDQVARVQSVLANTPAGQASLQPGDDILALQGQSLISPADVSWALHGAPDKGSLTAEISREGTRKTVSITLPENWRMHSDIARRVGTWPMRAMASGGLVLEDLSDAERAKRGLSNNQLALLIKHVGQYNEHALAKKAGFEKDDVVVSFDGIFGRTTESEILGRLLQAHQPGEVVKATVLRAEKKLDLSLPMQ